ncbi:restriction endonuclease subunit S [Faecalibaculum rodentium]|uniref:restriction endonuclease subunit S n=3 Tax=Faecalibaculum rodentium TaxID=1702221 RepID=UPI0025A958C3|nr:restriction endonuclease subunit S [Faecalibaculum rodentium]
MADNVPKIRFPGFTEPWEQRKLGELAEIVSGGTPATSNPEYWDGTINWYTPAEISEARYVYGSQKKITEVGLNNSSAKILPKDRTILFTSRAGIGKTAILKNDASTNQGFQSIVVKNNIDPEFVYSMSTQIKEKAERVAAGSTFSEISGKQLGKIILMIPGIKEQQRIGELFSIIDNLITLHQRKLDDLKKLKSGLLQKMFPKAGETVPEVRFPEFTGDWEQRKLGEIGNTFSGLSGKTKEDFGHGQASFVTYLNVFNNSIGQPNMIEKVEIDPKQFQVKQGDILFTTSSETPDEVGMACVWPVNLPNLYLNSFCFGFRPKKEIDINFYAHMLRSPQVRNQITLLAQGISRYNISKTKMMDIRIWLPSESEQRRIGRFLGNIDNLITLHQRKLDDLKKLKQGLLQQMLV